MEQLFASGIVRAQKRWKRTLIETTALTNFLSDLETSLTGWYLEKPESSAPNRSLCQLGQKCIVTAQTSGE